MIECVPFTVSWRSEVRAGNDATPELSVFQYAKVENQDAPDRIMTFIGLLYAFCGILHIKNKAAPLNWIILYVHK